MTFVAWTVTSSDRLYDSLAITPKQHMDMIQGKRGLLSGDVMLKVDVIT